MSVRVKSFGKSPANEDLFLYTIVNSKGMEASVTNVGAILVSLIVPNKAGEYKDVVLGFSNGSDYYNNGSFFGATVGRNANRIGKASFTLDGKKYELDKFLIKLF